MSKLPILCRIRIKNDENTFYSYDVRGADLWFSQENRTGNIYSVSVALPDHLSEFELFVRDKVKENLFYPQYIEIESNMKMDSINLDNYVAKIKEVQEICSSIMEVFEFEEHKNVYLRNH